MVEAVRKGSKLRAVARLFGTSLTTVQYWLERAGNRPIHEVDWGDRSSRPHRIANHTPEAVERRVVQARLELAKGPLGFVGALAVQEYLTAQPQRPIPSLRTIGRILVRQGLLDRTRRIRHPAPPPGWYLAAAAAGEAEMDHFDVIEDLRLEGGPLVSVFTGCPLWQGPVLARPALKVGARDVVDFLRQHWLNAGLPRYAQFDNDTRFQGGHNHPDVIGRVMRFCLALGVIPVFATPAEYGFQNIPESFNGRWQLKVWHRFHHDDLQALVACSDRFVDHYTRHRGQRRIHHPPRQPFPVNFRLDLQAPPRGCIIYLRRTDENGHVQCLGRRWEVDSTWLHRMVRAEVDLDRHCIRFYRLRRKEPSQQPLITECPYVLPSRSFLEG